MRALEHPRWEDYTYEPLDGHTNRFFWAGNGTTVAEETPDADSEFPVIPQRCIVINDASSEAWYLSEVDVPPGELIQDPNIIHY